MGEFFILKKFQGKNIGFQAAKEIFENFVGKWSVAVMPANLKGLNFWRKVVKEVSNNNFSEIFKTADELKTKYYPHTYEMNILSFNNKK